VQIPVYLADSLFLPSEVVAPRFGEVPGYEIRFGVDRRVSIPEALVKAADLFDPAIAACAEVAVSHAKDDGESPKSLAAYLERSVPGLATRADFPAIQAALWKFTTELADLIATQRDSIWAFIVRNAYRPAMLRARFDLLIGNPPWLSYRYIADPEYQAEIKRRAVEEYAIAPRSKKLMTQMELATVFLVHTLSTFGRSGARLAFVMPRSVLTADQHANLRDRSYSAPVRLDGYWDLREVEPVFKVPACVLFATHERVLPSVTYTLPAREWSGRLSERDVSWPEAEPALSSTKKDAAVARLGTHTAFTTKKGQSSSDEESPYAGRFRQGATIVPRSFYFVRVRDLDGAADPERLYSAETESEQAAQAKAPYKDVGVKGEVEGRFIYATALAKHVLPFFMLPPATVVLPAEVSDGEVKIRTAKWLREQGYRGLARWMTQADGIWATKRAGKAGRQSTYERLDYGKGLSCQRFDHRHVVLYNAAGTNLSATKLDRADLPLRFVVDHKLYWAPCDSDAEADYIAAVLNASVVNEWIKPFQSRGLMGERDIHKKVLGLPIPLFSSRDPQHRLISDLGGRASTEASRFMSRAELSSSLGKMRGAVRDALGETLKEIDAAVKTLLGR
jgi:hypothetical protein